MLFIHIAKRCPDNPLGTWTPADQAQQQGTQWQATNDARTLPTFSEIIDRASIELAATLDTLRSDWRPGHGPNVNEKAEAYREARRLLAQAQEALQRAW